MTRLTGKIKGLNTRLEFGFIESDSVIDGSLGNVKFWQNSINVPFSSLSRGDLVDFTVEDWWSTSSNCLIKISRDVKLIGRSQFSITNNPSNKNLKNKVIECLDIVETVTDHHEFEDLVFTLLRLMGINKLCQYDRNNAAGSADGVFISGSLCVVYDCTLKSPYMPYKDHQIFNYKKQLRSASSITINETSASGKVLVKKFSIPENREVWIITRGKTSVIQKADNIDNICVREVCIKGLIDMFNQKLDSQILGKLNID